MNSLKIALVYSFVFVVQSWANSEKSKPSIDLEDYIDVPIAKSKNEDLGTSATGYYGPHHYGHALGHHGYHHQAHPVYHQHAVEGGHQHHHHHNHGYEHIPYSGHGHDHAHTYFSGEYGLLGHAHIGSAHVSYGSNINHGHTHQHHGYHH